MQRMFRAAHVWGVIWLFIALSSHAGPNSWTLTGPDGGTITGIAIHPTKPAVILAGSRQGLHRSTNGGDDWTLVDATFNPPRHIAFDPSNPDRVFVTTDVLYRSTDEGRTLSRVTEIARADEIAIAGDGTIFVGAGDGDIYRSADGGIHWTALTRPWSGPVRLSAMAVDHGNANVLFVSIDFQGTYKSIDAGMSWTGPVAGSPGSSGSPQSPSSVYTLVAHPADSNRLLAATSRGILVSSDAGASWQDAALFQSTFSIVFDPFDPTRAIAMSGTGVVLRSADGGITWPNALIGADLREVGAAYVAVDPSTPDRLVVGGSDGPLFSSDGGETFELRTRGIHAGTVNVLASADDGTIYAALKAGPRGVFRRGTSSWEALDNAELLDALDRPIHLSSIDVESQDSESLYVVNSEHGVIRSTDGGESWSMPDAGFLSRASQVVRVAIDPTNNDVAYVSTLNTRLWKTEDGGSHWVQRSTGLPAHVDVIAIDPFNTDVIYVSAGADVSLHELYKSVDGGLTWGPIAGLGSLDIHSLTIDPADSSVLYLCASLSVYKSTDAGASWTRLDFGPPYGTQTNTKVLLIDPARSSTLFAVGGGDPWGFMRSVDGGSTWEQVPLIVGNRPHPPNVGILNPLRPSMLIAGAPDVGIVEYEVAPDLSIELTPIASPLPTNGTVQSTLTVRNRGPHAASAARISLSLPNGLTTNTPDGCTLGGATLTCILGAIHAGQALAVPMTWTVSPTPANGTVSVSVEGHEPDADVSNNTVQLPLTWTEQADLELHLIASALSVERGNAVTLTATVTNHGPSRSTNTTFTLAIEEGMVVQQATASRGNCSFDRLSVSCAFGTLAASETATVTVVTNTTEAGTIQVTSEVEGAGTDVDMDQLASFEVTVRPVSDLGVTITQSTEPVLTNASFRHTVTASNHGPDAGDARLSVSISGASVVAVTPSTGTCTVAQSSIECALPALVSRGTAAVTLDLIAPNAGTATVDATVTASSGDPIAGNNRATASTMVGERPTPVVTPAPTNGGGGGALRWTDVALLMLLSLASAARSKRNRSLLRRTVDRQL